ncbi:putative efflux pump antibiotic resistance protein [Aspergillus karnatakaensis]|uniref:putative efflux pump antibiotic resistance protein n=1 Tax=Aspergillus karnatakaensis TaxID=1810916 RepID=UPI003CCE09B3
MIGEEWKPKKRDYLVLFSLALVSLVVALDSTILITSLPAISHDLGGTSTEAFWAATSYLLTYAVLQPVIASLSDIFGRRTSLFMSVLLFTIGSLIAAVAQNFACLLAGRTIQGIGGGGVMVLVLVIATDVVPLRYLPKYQGLVQIAWALGTMTGPLIGGIFAQLTTWRWVFYINFPICGIGLVLVPFVIPSGARTGSAKGRVVTIDFVGAALLVASFTTFLVAITLGGTTFPWGSVHIILPLVLGILGIAATFAWEIFAAQTPILRPSLFKRRFSTVPYLCAFLQGFLLMATFYYYALHLTPTKHLTPILTGTALLSATASLIPLSVLSGILISKTGHLRIFIVSGWALTILGTGLLSLSTQHTATPAWVWFLIVTGAGHGVLVVGHVYAAQANVQPQDAGNATAFCCFVRSVGFCAGVAVGGAVLQNVLEGKVAGRGLETGVGAGTDVISFAGMLRALPRGEQRTETLMDVFSESFRVLALVLTGIGGVGGGLSVFVPRFVAGYTSSRVQAEGV